MHWTQQNSGTVPSVSYLLNRPLTLIWRQSEFFLPIENKQNLHSEHVHTEKNKLQIGA